MKLKLSKTSIVIFIIGLITFLSWGVYGGILENIDWLLYSVLFILFLIFVGVNWLPTILNLNITKDQMYFSYLRAGVYIFYLFYIYFAIKTYYISTYVFGIISVLITYYHLYYAYINRDHNKNPISFSLLIDFIWGLVITINLIYIIRIDTLRNIMIAFISSLYGGFITLLGVGWTIKQSEKEKIQEEIRRNKPLLFLVDPKYSSYDNKLLISKRLDTIIFEGDNFNGRKNYKVNHFILENGDYSYSSIVGFMINDDFIRLRIGQIFAKNRSYFIYTDNINFKYKNKIERVYLVLRDMIDKIYLADMNFKLEAVDKVNKIIFESIVSIKITDKIKLDEDQQLILNHSC